MIKQNFKVKLNQQDQNNLVLQQVENELGAVNNSDRISKGIYVINITNAFKDAVFVTCPQNKVMYNTVGGASNSFVLYGEVLSDSEFQVQTLDSDLNPWEDSLSGILLEITVYKNDFIPV